MSKAGGSKSKSSAPAAPSASVLLISHDNSVLLLHRVQKASAFPSAHVFAGGNIDPFHDGEVPPEGDPLRHEDGPAYRLAAIRETFEESGILLAKNNGFGRLIEVSEADREEGRKKVHGSEVNFGKWLAGKGGRPDVDNLIPFTRWITPPMRKKRFTTQMYIYFLPLATTDSGTPGTQSESVIQKPRHDGGIEHTAARFLPAAEWLRLANAGELILMPPQYFLLTMLANYLCPPEPRSAPYTAPSKDQPRRMPYQNPAQADTPELQRQRQRLREFVKTSNPPWGRKVMSPYMLFKRKDGKVVFGLDRPGPELEGSGRRGDSERVVVALPGEDLARGVEVQWKSEVFEEERRQASKTSAADAAAKL